MDVVKFYPLRQRDGLGRICTGVGHKLSAVGDGLSGEGESGEVVGGRVVAQLA